MRIELFALDLELATMQVKSLFNINLSTMKQFIIDDTLIGIATLLLVPDLFGANKHTLRSLR